MSRDRSKFIKLGLFVSVALVLFVVGIYNIGSKKNLFGSNLKISAEFSNIKGALPGNNVRYSGLTVGSVESIDLINDSLLKVNMNIDKAFVTHIKKNATTSIGTHGLVGEKVIDITPSSSPSNIIEDGDVLRTSKTAETQAMLSTLDQTNDNFLAISKNIRQLTDRLNQEDLSSNIGETTTNLEVLTSNLIKLSDDVSIVINDVKSGKGALGYLLNDPSFSNKTNQLFEDIDAHLINKTAPILSNLESSSITVNNLSHKIDSLIKEIDLNEGMIGLLLKNATAAEKTHSLLDSLEMSAQLFNENMVALQHNFFFKRYFKKKNKKKQTKN